MVLGSQLNASHGSTDSVDSTAQVFVTPTAATASALAPVAVVPRDLPTAAECTVSIELPLQLPKTVAIFGLAHPVSLMAQPNCRLYDLSILVRSVSSRPPPRLSHLAPFPSTA